MKKQKKKKTPKKNSLRSKTKYPALKPELNLKYRQHLIDYDYLDKLGPEELEFLNQFTNESVCNVLDRKDFNNNLVNTLEWKQECDRLNNARRQDLFSLKNAQGSIILFSNMLEDTETDNPLTELLNKELDDSEDCASNSSKNGTNDSNDF